MSNKTVTQTVAERAAAKVLGVEHSEIMAALEDKEGTNILGVGGFDIEGLVKLILEFVLTNLDGCFPSAQAFRAIRGPGLFGSTFAQRRAVRIFQNGHPLWMDYGRAVAQAVEIEAKELTDTELSDAFREARHPEPRHLVF